MKLKTRSVAVVLLAGLATAAWAQGKPRKQDPTPFANAHVAGLAAQADAAKRLNAAGTKTPAPEILKAEAVTWTDGSIGCPKPDMSYTQALIPGYRISIKAGNETWDYHLSDRGALVLCPPGRSLQPLPDTKS